MSLLKKVLFIVLFAAQSIYAGVNNAKLLRTEKISSLDWSIAITTGMTGIAVSTDNRHVACIVRSHGNIFVYRDGTNNDSPFDDIREDSLVFSPDGKHLAYVANRFGKWMVVLDNVPQGQNEDIITKSLTFSPDSSRLAYIAKGFMGWQMIIDGKPGQAYSFFKEDAVSFSPDSAHLAYVAGLYNRCYVILDGDEIGEYNMLVPAVKVVWDSPNTFHYLAIDNNRDIIVVSYKI